MNSLQHRRRLAGCRIGLAILAVSGILGFSATARGTDFLQGEAVTVDAETVYEGDLFVIGQSITISGTVQGDLFVAGETIKVDGKVGGSAHLAGNTIEVAGEVGGSARVAGREIELSSTARVGRDVMAAGEIIRAVVDSEVAGQLYGGGRLIELQGTISKTVFLGCDSATLGGVFESDVNINCSGIQTQPDATGLNIADTATIQGDLLIRTPAPTSVTIAEEATIAGTQDIVEISQADAAPKDPIRAYVRTWLVTWLQLGLLGLAFRLVLPGRTKKYLQNLQRLPILAALLGPIYWVLILVGGGLALVAGGATIAGLSIIELPDLVPMILFTTFVIVVAVWGGGSLLGFVMGPVLTGAWFCKLILGWLPFCGKEAMLVPILIGTCLVSAGIAVPDYGWIVWLVTAAFGSGAFLTRSQAEPPPAAPAMASAGMRPTKQRIR